MTAIISTRQSIDDQAQALERIEMARREEEFQCRLEAQKKCDELEELIRDGAFVPMMTSLATTVLLTSAGAAMISGATETAQIINSLASLALPKGAEVFSQRNQAQTQAAQFTLRVAEQTRDEKRSESNRRERDELNQLFEKMLSIYAQQLRIAK